MKVYCAVEPDKYERIVFIENSPSKLADVMGVPRQTLACAKCRGNKCRGLKIIEVEIEDESELA